MRHGRHGLIVAALVAACAPGRSAPAGEEPGPAGPITIIGSPALLPEGTRCAVALKPEEGDKETVETTYEGRVLRATDASIELSVSEERRVVTGNYPLARLPIPILAPRLFRSVGIARPSSREEKTVTIPVETILSVVCRDDATE